MTAISDENNSKKLTLPFFAALCVHLHRGGCRSKKSSARTASHYFGCEERQRCAQVLLITESLVDSIFFSNRYDTSSYKALVQGIGSVVRIRIVVV